VNHLCVMVRGDLGREYFRMDLNSVVIFLLFFWGWE
jgi:hypothetical protein